ncbi:undecaprenyl-diphosphate phosphatase [Candidatus Uhrbacteria bacterium]|jgi:undecaprenyl-diphosphatase|nr:undecaprenyl-diphosphate phosphatase [Candidatus Uhrbacteria bacterium]MBT7717231.1 undecaprenyl-diphosphate phosphatase [Candidatus Uhrbacteria bacterium]
MTFFQAIIAGVVQGITEFLPVSSSGHLIVVRELFGIQVDSLSFDVAVHIATLVAVVWVLRGEILDIIREFFSKKWLNSVGLKIVVATIPAVIFGLWLRGDLLDALRTTQIVGYSLIFWGIVLYAADVYLKKKKGLVKKVQNIRWLQAIFIGCAQAIALIPGTSRAGITMTAGLFAKVDRVRAARFSFLLSIPAILGAGVLTMFDAIETGLDIEVSALIIGCIAALLSGIVAIKVLLKFLEKGSFFGFAVYRIILGVLLLVFL